MNTSWRVVGAVLGVVALFILIIILVFGNKPSVRKDISTHENLTLSDYASRGSSVSFTTDGPINALETHRTIKITVSANVRNLTIFKGYNGEILQSTDLTNTENAYSQFLQALEQANFTLVRVHPKSGTELKAQCPTGRRYIFDIVAAPTDKQSWTTSCSLAEGTFAGNFSITKTLFQSQIPDYSTLTAGVSI